ncbi:MAG: hypothetical protein NTW60_00240 [Candidatus Wolfebacteria bacterium]|nr:hypothetical protein [Candidatus Wolfebacteria bacterium]
MPSNIEEMEKLTEKCVKAAKRAWVKSYHLCEQEPIGRLASVMLDYCLRNGIDSDQLGDFPPEEEKK